MKPEIILSHEFVEYIPDDLKDGIIYVSMPYATAVHKCCCGCGNQVVTPLSPTDWTLMFDGRSVSLDPSIGNWSFSCQSHYWIEQNRVRWARRWSTEEIEQGRAHDRLSKRQHFQSLKGPVRHDRTAGTGAERTSKEGLWQKLKRWWS